MDSSHTNNTGSANFISDYNIISGQTPASELDDAYRTTVYGYPILLFYKLNQSDKEQHFIGVYNLNLDKSCTGSFGFEEELDDSNEVTYDFKEVRYIDDELSSDILVRSTISGDNLTETEETMQIVSKDENGELVRVEAVIMQNTEGEKIACRYNDTFYRINYVNEKPYVVLKNPIADIECALLTSDNYIRTLSFDKVSSTQCDEFKANSGAAGAGGFGNYNIESISKDLECRYPDDGDLEEEQYEAYQTYVKSLGKKPIDFSYFKAPWYYNYQRMMKWVKNSSDQEFTKNISRNFNKTYVMDYYLTIMLLGGVDSLGKNLMVATWGPENHLFETTAEALDPVSESYDKDAFEYVKGDSVVYLTPNKVTKDDKYIHATNEAGFLLYYKEECYNRSTKLFENGYTKFDSSCVTTVPGNDIFYPIFYDIDTINGLDNSGQLLFDVDIEIGDQLADGTAIFNTDDSHLWRRVRDYLGNNGDLKARWEFLRSSGYFTQENLIDKFYYERQIAKIPEKYYNDDCFLKYIWEGPNVQKGSGTYLYCIHGSRYEHIKRWYSQRMYYIDTMFGIMGGDNSSLRFNHGSYDANFGHIKDYYASYPALAAKNPDKYVYNQEDGTLRDAASNREIIPIDFNVKTYQPAYVGVKWANTGSILYYRVGRNGSVTMRGNVPSAGDSEVFLFGGSNIKELGDLSPYNVKQVDFRNLTKLSKLILGSSEYASVINKLDLGTNTYLAELQLNNCSSLSTIDVSGCSNLRTLDMTGSGITTVTLPSGGALESISYSDVITSLNLQDFVNLNTVTTPNLTNLTKLIVKNCPKILGSKDNPNAKGWAILQKTKSATNLTDIEMTSYGNAEPTISNNEEWFFADKYYNYATAKKICGEVNYKGSVIPKNYAYFKKSFPKLSITYSNIKDGSEMFANYKNMACIQTVQAYTGNNQYGEPQYKDIFYWADNTPELRAKWQNPEAYSKYGYSEKYTSDTVYYYKAGIYYRTMGIHDSEDLDNMRTEIKDALYNFKGVKFDSVKGMFRNNKVIDYLDPDTFNDIDLSTANTDEMFYGCSNLQYLTLPGDYVKNEKLYLYFNDEGVQVPEDSWSEINGTKVEKTDENGNPLYREAFTGKETILPEFQYPKGIRRLGDKMFYECRKLRLLIKYLSTTEKINISPTAFEYVAYDPTLESQDNKITVQRPVIMFEMSDENMLTVTSEPLSSTSDGEIENILIDNDRYFKVVNKDLDREINYDNNFIDFNSSSKWLREVYFNVNDMILNDTSVYPDYSVSYATTMSGEKILLDAYVTDSKNKNNIDNFNKSSGKLIENKLNIISACQGSLEKTSDHLKEIELPLPKYDCLSKELPRQDFERSVLSLFSSKNFTDFNSESIEANLPVLEKFFISKSERVTPKSFYAFKNLKCVGLSDSVKIIGNQAFANCSKLERIAYEKYTGIGVEYTLQTANVHTIESQAFENSGLSAALYMPNAIENLGDAVFANCKNLSSVVYPENLTYIPNSTFSNCENIITVSGVTNDLTEIGENAFFNCSKFEFYRADGTLNLCSGKGNLDYFTSLHTIGANAFYKCNNISKGFPDENGKLSIKKLIIPVSLRYIGPNAFSQDLGGESQINIEFVWSATDGDYSNLVIETGAFANIRTSWTPKGYSEPIEDCIFIPRVAYLGESAFRSKGGNNPFKFALTKNTKDEIGEKWISTANKIIYDFEGIVENDRVTYLLSNSEQSSLNNQNNITSKKAYIYHVGETLTNFTFPRSTHYNGEEFIVKEILSGALDMSQNSLSVIIFDEGSELEIIEKNVLKSNNLTTIISVINSENVLNVIPENLKIESGNVLKNTTWFDIVDIDGFVVLGKYIIGAKSTNNKLTHIDFTDDSVKNCTTIFDDAFKEDKDIEKITLSESITKISDSAFEGCTKINSVDLLKVKEIGNRAFLDCPITDVFIPNTVEKVGSNIFGKSNQNSLGVLKSVIFEDGSRLSSFPVSITREIKTNSDPTDANITLNRIHIPSSDNEIISSSSLKLLSQVTELTVGNLKVAEDGSYLIDNYPLYVDADGNRSITNVTGSYEYAIDKNGNRLYCPAFYYDMVKTKFPDLFIETTAEKSVYPLSDTAERSGYSRNLDIGFIMKYPEATQKDGIDVSDIVTKDLTREDIMRIIAGFTKKGNTIYTLAIRASDYRKLTISDVMVIGDYKVKLQQYKNK